MHYKPPTFNALFQQPRMRKKHAFNALVCYLGGDLACVDGIRSRRNFPRNFSCTVRTVHTRPIVGAPDRATPFLKFGRRVFLSFAKPLVSTKGLELSESDESPFGRNFLDLNFAD